MEDYKIKTDLIRKAKEEASISPAMVANAVDAAAEHADTLVAALGAIPTVQTTQNGTSGNYIYSTNSSSAMQVLTVRDTGFYHNANNDLYMKLGFWHTDQSIERTVSISCPYATPTRAGFMSKEAMAKLNALPTNADLTANYAKKTELPDMVALSSSIGARDNIFSYDESNPNGKKAVQGNLLFALTTLTKDDEGNIITEASTPEQIKAALTEFTSKNVLTYADLAYCATHGAMLFDQSTNAYVQVTHNGGGFFNFMELLVASYAELPKLRYVCIRITEDGTTWQVKRAGNSDRLVTLTEFGSMMQMMVDQMAALDERLTVLENKGFLELE